jgi:AAA15 family ATPase/GTPase
VHIKSFEVIGLLNRDSPLRLEFHPDLNIVTGRNGSGKTSILKLLWYIMSGNILQALREVNFKKAILETSDYSCTVYRLSKSTCRIDWHDSNSDCTFEDIEDDDGGFVVNAEDQANKRLTSTGSSVFLPTFRRIEGGFTLSDPEFLRADFLRAGLSRAKNDIRLV